MIHLNLSAIFGLILGLSLLTPKADAAKVSGNYLLFSSNAEAVQWYRNSPTSRMGGSVIDVTDPRYQQAKAKIDQVWKGFSDLYPDKTAETQAPFPVITESNSKDARVTSDPVTGKIPQIVIITTGFFSVTDDNPWLGLMGHELTHYVFQHSLSGVETRVWKFYRSNEAEEPTGASQKDDPEIRKIVMPWMRHLEWAGGILTGQLHGMALPFQQNGLPFFILQFLANREKVNHPNECAAFLKNQSAMAQIVFKSFSFGTGLITLSPTDKDEIEVLSSKWKDIAAGCFGGLQEPLDKLLKEMTGSRASILIEDRNIYDAQGTILNGLSALVEYHAVAALNIQKNHQDSWDLFRYYSQEDEADLISVKVLRHLGLKSDSLADFFFSLLKSQEQLICSNGDRAPYYGTLSDPHHSLCFRIFNIRRASQVP